MEKRGQSPLPPPPPGYTTDRQYFGLPKSKESTNLGFMIHCLLCESNKFILLIVGLWAGILFQNADYSKVCRNNALLASHWILLLMCSYEVSPWGSFASEKCWGRDTEMNLSCTDPCRYTRKFMGWGSPRLLQLSLRLRGVDSEGSLRSSRDTCIKVIGIGDIVPQQGL